jgi:hypothetical protein
MTGHSANSENEPGAANTASRRPRWLRVLRLAVAISVVASVASSPWWGRNLLMRLDYFRVQRVEINGLRHLEPADILTRMAVDTFASVWMPLEPVEERIAEHPDLLGATISRKLPGTLVVSVHERAPVAMVPSPTGMIVYDGSGTALPLDPTRTSIDVPIVSAGDSGIFRLLDRVRIEEPRLFARISEMRRVEGEDELQVKLSSLRVRAPYQLSPARLAEVLPVEEDLRRRGYLERATELDLRYRDQVIARLQ